VYLSIIKPRKRVPSSKYGVFILMSISKIRRIHNFQHSSTFSSLTEAFDAFYARFLESDRGKVYIAIL